MRIRFFFFVEEVGELAKAIRKNNKLMVESGSAVVDETQVRDNLGEEFADCLGYLFDLANRYDINLGRVYQKKVAVNLTRSWK